MNNYELVIDNFAGGGGASTGIERALVTVDGHEYQIADIGLRMLRPKELLVAQGFPPDYQLTGTLADQVAMIGNSVSPHPAEALVRANYTQPQTQEATT